MFTELLQDLLQDIKDDGNFPLEASNEDQVTYLKDKAVGRSHLRESIEEFDGFLQSGGVLKSALEGFKVTEV